MQKFVLPKYLSWFFFFSFANLFFLQIVPQVLSCCFLILPEDMMALQSLQLRPFKFTYFLSNIKKIFYHTKSVELLMT